MIKNIIFDFDGVIFYSEDVKTYAFRQAIAQFGEQAQDKLESYHKEHGGVSRYAKFAWFFETLIGKSASQEEIQAYADKFASNIALSMQDPSRLIQEVVQFIYDNHKKYNLHIASGADQRELQSICKLHHLDSYFLSICGSPVHKSMLIENIMLDYGYKRDETCLIGDAYTDLEAAKDNQIIFFGYNNSNLKIVGNNYIEPGQFKEFWETRKI